MDTHDVKTPKYISRGRYETPYGTQRTTTVIMVNSLCKLCRVNEINGVYTQSSFYYQVILLRSDDFVTHHCNRGIPFVTNGAKREGARGKVEKSGRISSGMKEENGRKLSETGLVRHLLRIMHSK